VPNKNNLKLKTKMKRMLFLAAGFAVLLMTACGGEEKKDDKKEEKKEVTAETKEKFESLKTEWSTIDVMITSIDESLVTYDDAKESAYIDSMKTVAGKAKKDVQSQAMPLLDSLTALRDQVADWKNIVNGEKETWGMITEDFTAVITSIEKGEADENKIAPRAEGFTEQFKYKTETIAEISKNWGKIVSFKSTLNALFAPATK
jgi:ABC-type oligopeptide transport system substrate-binding subunit